MQHTKHDYSRLDGKKVRRKISEISQSKRKRSNRSFVIFNCPEECSYFQEYQEKLHSYVKWTMRQSINNEKDPTGCQTFNQALREKVKNSLLAAFIKEFNNEETTKEEQELKLGVTKQILKTRDFPNQMDKDNNFVDDLTALVEHVVRSEPSGMATYEQLLNTLTHLRLADRKIDRLDFNCRNMRNLESLVLSGNLLRNVRLDKFPRGLRFLELASNCIQHFRPTSIRPPLIYLGLSYNKINDSSNLTGLQRVTNILCLDLSDNNISDIMHFLSIVGQLPFLSNLSLIGNPCSVRMDYTLTVIKSLPELKFLDGEPLDIKSPNLKKKYFEVPGECARLKIYIFRILGLTKPAATGASRKYYEFEVSLPLLDGNLKKRILYKIEDKYSDLSKSSVSEEDNLNLVKKTPSKPESPKKGGKFSPTNKNKTHSPNSLIDTSLAWKEKLKEFLDEDALLKGVNYLKSNKFSWSPVIKMKNPAFELLIKEDDIVNLRDTLRSIIILRLYLVEDHLSNKKKKVERLSSILSVPELQRTLVAKIPIPAEVVHWKNSHVSYSWDAKNPYMAKKCMKIEEFKFGTGWKKQTRRANLSPEQRMFPIPDYPAVHLGISLNRK